MTLPRGLRIVGFTLVELLVVLVVLAVATSLITVSVSAASGHVLEGAGEQLAASLEEARWQAISTGRRIAFETPAAHTHAACGRC
jgi:general secretion pathway protein H